MLLEEQPPFPRQPHARLQDVEHAVEVGLGAGGRHLLVDEGGIRVRLVPDGLRRRAPELGEPQCELQLDGSAQRRTVALGHFPACRLEPPCRIAQRLLEALFADGKAHHTLYSVSGFRKPDGSPGGLVGVIVDIEPRSPAARMGFQPGDVVMQAQGEEVEGARQLAEVVEARSRVWRITFNRGGRVSRIVVGG